MILANSVILPHQVRIVNIVADTSSSGRRRRNAGTTAFDVEIGDPPKATLEDEEDKTNSTDSGGDSGGDGGGGGDGDGGVVDGDGDSDNSTSVEITPTIDLLSVSKKIITQV